MTSKETNSDIQHQNNVYKNKKKPFYRLWWGAVSPTPNITNLAIRRPELYNSNH